MLKNRLILPFVFATAVMVLMSSCEPDGIDGGGDKVVPKSELELAFVGQIADEPLPPKGETIFKEKSFGESMMITNWSFLMSNLALVKEDGDTVQLGDGYQWADLRGTRNVFNYKGIPLGKYKGLQFTMGFDSATNHGNPQVWPSDHPMNPNINGLHWGWAGGYIFQAMDGRYKENADAASGSFSFHTATMQFVTRYFLPLELNVEKSKHRVAVRINADRFFGGAESIRFKDKSVSHSEGAQDELLMRIFLDNSLYAFRIFEE
jgi:hypothetical protein